MVAKKPAPKKAPKDSTRPNVFISWSGPRSLHVATALYDALKLMIDAARPWRSDEDIRSGKAWFPEIISHLKEIEIGIVILTPENLKAEWLNFEAGALAGKLSSESLVIPVRVGGVRTVDVKPPLSQYQGGEALDSKFMFKLVRDINDATGVTVAPDMLAKKFEMVWPDLEKRLKALPAAVDPVPKPPDIDDVAAEILNLVRGIRADVAPRSFLEHMYGPSSGGLSSLTFGSVPKEKPSIADTINALAHRDLASLEEQEVSDITKLAEALRAAREPSRVPGMAEAYRRGLESVTKKPTKKTIK